MADKGKKVRGGIYIYIYIYLVDAMRKVIPFFMLFLFLPAHNIMNIGIEEGGNKAGERSLGKGNRLGKKRKGVARRGWCKQTTA